jgi:hypothetical protein
MDSLRQHATELKEAETYLKYAREGALKADALELVRRARHTQIPN